MLVSVAQVAGMLVTLRVDFHPVVQTIIGVAQLSNVDLVRSIRRSEEAPMPWAEPRHAKVCLWPGYAPELRL